MATPHHSFTLPRPGLKAGYYVPLRLCIVDTLSVLSAVPLVVALVALLVNSLSWADRLGLGVIWRNPFAFYAYAIGTALIVGWGGSYTAVALLRFVFRVAGMMTREEARSFRPLPCRLLSFFFQRTIVTFATIVNEALTPCIGVKICLESDTRSSHIHTITAGPIRPLRAA